MENRIQKSVASRLILPLIMSFLGSSAAVAADADLFAEKVPLSFSLSADFKTLFTHRLAPNSPKTEETLEYLVPGTIVYKNNKSKLVQIPVEVKLRGNTSQKLDECEFPKLKLKFNKADVKGTAFENQKAVGVGTHCAMKPGYSSMQRLLGGLSPFRESIVYDMAHELQIPTYQTRRAYGTYSDSEGKVIATNVEAFFLEDMSSLETRMKGHEVRDFFLLPALRSKSKTPPPYLFKSVEESPGIVDLDMAKMLAFESLISNQDFVLKLTKDEPMYYQVAIFNAKVLELSPVKWIIFPFDFDLSKMVTGRPADTAIAHLGTKFSSATLQAMADHFNKHKSALYKIPNKLPANDPEGVQNFRSRLDQFFALLK